MTLTPGAGDVGKQYTFSASAEVCHPEGGEACAPRSGSTSLPTRRYAVWGGKATQLLPTEPSMDLVVGEARPGFFLAFAGTGSGDGAFSSERPVYSVDNAAVATVDRTTGLVTARAVGEAKLLARTMLANQTLPIKVTAGTPRPSG